MSVSAMEMGEEAPGTRPGVDNTGQRVKAGAREGDTAGPEGSKVTDAEGGVTALGGANSQRLTRASRPRSGALATLLAMHSARSR